MSKTMNHYLAFGLNEIQAEMIRALLLLLTHTANELPLTYTANESTKKFFDLLFEAPITEMARGYAVWLAGQGMGMQCHIHEALGLDCDEAFDLASSLKVQRDNASTAMMVVNERWRTLRERAFLIFALGAFEQS